MTRHKIQPVLQTLKGWNTVTSEIHDSDHLPFQMKDYVEYINNFVDVRVSYISNGPGRDQLVQINKGLK
jgi:adenylosuccinate synthase